MPKKSSKKNTKSKPKQKTKPNDLKSKYKFLAVCSGVVLILLISTLNIKSKSNKQPKEVLGAEATNVSEIQYWKEFLTSNPYYINGWIRLVELEKENGNLVGAANAELKIHEINPNYQRLSN